MVDGILLALSENDAKRCSGKCCEVLERRPEKTIEENEKDIFQCVEQATVARKEMGAWKLSRRSAV